MNWKSLGKEKLNIICQRHSSLINRGPLVEAQQEDAQGIKKSTGSITHRTEELHYFVAKNAQ